MLNQFWNIFAETGEPMCYLLCKAEETGKPVPEIRPIPEEFKINPEPQRGPPSPH